jgi:tetratricopeptide (TPR) repeat protein
LGQFEHALDAFSQAYELKPLPGFLFNIAQCHRHLGNFERASFFYKRYLTLASLVPPDAAVVNDLLREVETKQAERKRAREEEAQAAAERERELVRIAAAKAEAEAAEQRRSEIAAKAQADEEMQRRAAMLRLDMERKNGQSGDGKNQLVHKWWFWTGVGLVAAGAGTTIYFATSHSSSPTLNPINGR